MLGRAKLDNTLLTCDQSNFNQITARCRNRTLVTVVRDTSTTTVPPARRKSKQFINSCSVHLAASFGYSAVWKADGSPDPSDLAWQNICCMSFLLLTWLKIMKIMFSLREIQHES